MNLPSAAVVILLATLSSLTRAESVHTLALSRAQADALGITTQTPAPAKRARVLRANARVMIPPASEHSANAMFSGFLARLLVAAGDRVSAGQLLAELNSAEFLHTQREYLTARSERDLSSEALRRDEALFNDGIISRRRLEETRERARAASIVYTENQQLLRLSGLNADQFTELEQTGQLLSTEPVRAPISGVILKRLVQTGDAVDAQAPIYRLADLSTLWLEIPLNHADVPGLMPGMSFQINESNSRQQADNETAASPVDGTISVIGSLVERQSQTVTVRGVVASGRAAGLHPDQVVSVTIYGQPADSGTQDSDWSVPAQSLVRHQGSEFVFVATDRSVEVRRIRATAATEGYINVSAGLRAGDRVVVTGVAALKTLWLAGDEE